MADTWKLGTDKNGKKYYLATIGVITTEETLEGAKENIDERILFINETIDIKEIDASSLGEFNKRKIDNALFRIITDRKHD